MKRWISLLLCLTMAGSLLPFALADEESADARLKRVTEQVKTTLDLDTDSYTEFRGSPSEQELGAVWSLNWTDQENSLSVEALEDGTVVSYWLSDGKDRSVWTQNLPAFPRADPAQARQAADTFLNKVLDRRTESVQLKEPEDRQLRSSAVRFYGNILLNNLPSPLTYSVTVRGEDNVVTNFRRDAPSRTFLGNIPSPTPSVTKADAAAKLRGTETLELLYVIDEAASLQPTARQTASARQTPIDKPVLRYVPKREGTWAVDAQTGEVKDISDSGIGLFRANGAAPTAEAAAMDSGASMKSLNAVEQAGVEKLEGVLNQDALDRAIRAEAAYQLTDAYTIQSANYRLVKESDGKGGETERVICTLRYTAGEKENPIPLYEGADAAATGAAVAAKPSVPQPDHTFTVDARTGAVELLYTSERWNQDAAPAVTADQAMETAKNYLFRFASGVGVDAARLELRDTEDRTADGAPSFGFTFARKENGVFFPADSVSVRVDCVTGAVTGVNYTWHKTLSTRDFPSPAQVVTSDAALTAWMGAYDTVLAYRLLPRDLKPEEPAEAKLIAIGMTKFYDLFLSYSLERPEGSDYTQYESCPGIDALTGKPVTLPAYKTEKLAYSDIAGIAAEADILKLADYGIGYYGGKFQPGKSLSQWELACLLASSQGFRLDPDTASEEEKNSAYNTVYYMGALDRQDRHDDNLLTRNGAVKLLLNAAGFAPSARLTDIYTTKYLDQRSIPAEDLGYAAHAQALGMVPGSTYSAAASITRAEAASMLCRLMERPN